MRKRKKGDSQSF